MFYAAIDLGTVTSRLMIGELSKNKIIVHKRNIIVTDLGEGLSQTGTISEAAYKRLTAALIQFRQDIDEFKTELARQGSPREEIPVRIVATSAMRDASNASEIVSNLAKQGFNIEIIHGNTEAELSFKGTLSGFDKMRDIVLSIDVGGGSTELILGTKASHILASHSFDIGCRRITELFLKSDPYVAEELKMAQEWVSEETKAFIKALPEQPSEILAVAGTATSAITMRDQIEEYDSSLVHGKSLSIDEIQALLNMLSAQTLKERKSVPGLDPKRAPVIVGGLLILLTLLKELGASTLLVSDIDILQGILLSSADV